MLNAPSVGALMAACGGTLTSGDEALLGLNRAQSLDDLETPGARLGDVHVHPHVMLAWHHGGRTAGAFDDLGVIQGRDHVRLGE